MKIEYRRASASDIDPVLELYKDVASTPGGLARTLPEITKNYILNWAQRSLSDGLWIIANDPAFGIVGSIHAYRLEPKVFSHILSELTIAICSGYQGKGIGKALFNHFLAEVETNFPDILRVELIARESNRKAIKMYESLGFSQEGKMQKRIKSISAGYEADIPMAWIRK